LHDVIDVNRQPADAKKNVLSSAMGIHLLRLWAKTAERRPNAKSRIALVVRRFWAMVEALKFSRNRPLKPKSLSTIFLVVPKNIVSGKSFGLMTTVRRVGGQKA